MRRTHFNFNFNKTMKIFVKFLCFTNFTKLILVSANQSQLQKETNTNNAQNIFPVSAITDICPLDEVPIRTNKLIKLGCLEEESNDSAQALSFQTIPNIIHKIWFGPMSEKYKKSIMLWKSKHPEYQIKLWSDNFFVDDETWEGLKIFCSDLEIHLLDIDDYLHYPNMDLIKYWLELPEEKVGKYRFAAASDLLRVSIISIQGGHYSDMDIEPKHPLPHDMQVSFGHYLPLAADLIEPVILKNIGCVEFYYENCFMGAVRGHQVYARANRLNEKIHQQTFGPFTKWLFSNEGKYNIKKWLDWTTAITIIASESFYSNTPYVFIFERGTASENETQYKELVNKTLSVAEIKGEISEKHFHVKFDESYADKHSLILETRYFEKFLNPVLSKIIDKETDENCFYNNVADNVFLPQYIRHTKKYSPDFRVSRTKLRTAISIRTTGH